MSELFSEQWMKAFQDAWNEEPELADELEKISFSSVIGYGFSDDEEPVGVLKVENGRVVDAGRYNGDALNWDLRADIDSWKKWTRKGIGMAGLGMAFTTGKLKFMEGDYKTMLKDPRMAGPFVKSFGVMARV